MPAAHIAYLAMVVVAFVSFMIVLGGVSTYVRMTSRPPAERRDDTEG